MPRLKRVAAAIAAAAMLIVGAAAWRGAAAQPSAPEAEACLARPTVVCAVELALAASGTNDDDQRARLLVRTAQRMKDVGARKAYLDEGAPRHFSDGSPAKTYLEGERRVIDIAAAAAAGEDASADRQLGEAENFQRRWKTLAGVIDVLAETGRPDLAVAFEARHRATRTVALTDALGRDLGKQVWSTRQLLASSLVRCDCGPDPLPMVLDLPRQVDRLDNALVLYARRHDVDSLVSFLTREFGNLAQIEDEDQRRWVGYGFGLMVRAAPVGDIPAVLRETPSWLTATHFRRPDSGAPPRDNIYGEELARAIEAGDRAAVAALVKLRTEDDTVWLSGMALGSPDGAEKVSDLLPKPERDHLWLLTTRYKLGNGDPGRELAEAMAAPVADVWRRPDLYDGVFDDEVFTFEFVVLEPLLTRGAFDVAEEALRQLQDEDWREALLARVAAAKKEGTATVRPKSAAALLAEHWGAYRQSQTPSEAGRSFLFAVRDLVRSQPEAFPLE